MSNPIVYVVRHGKTKFNDPKDERFRSFINLPLDENGRKDAARIGKLLCGLGIATILSSDLDRARETAEIIGKEIGIKPKLTTELRPWNLGRIAGQRISEVGDVVQKFQQDTPEKKVPGGESYSEFFNRWSEILHSALAYAEKHPDKPVLLVTHSRNLLALDIIIEGKDLKDVPIKGGPDPGNAVMIEKTGDKWKAKELG